MLRTAVVAGTIAVAFALKTAQQASAGARGISHFIDDALYYLIIARNFAWTGVPTFDGVHVTNGFHPLWMLLLAAMHRVIGPDADVFRQIVGVKVLEAITLGCALAVCVFAFHKLRDRTLLAWGFLGAALIFLVPSYDLWEQGMESTLAAAFLVAAWYALLDRKPALFAASLALLFLARLDTLVFVIAPLALAWLWRAPAGWRSAWRPLVPVAVVAAAYIALNLALTGHATPISGQIKSSFPMMTPHFEYLRAPIDVALFAGWPTLYAGPNILVATLATLMLSAACAFSWKTPWSHPVALALAIAALLIANVLLFQRWDKGVEARYLALAFLMLGIAAMTMAAAWLAGPAEQGAQRWRSRWAPALLVIVLLAACAGGTYERMYGERDRRLDRTKHLEVMKIIGPRELSAGTDVGSFAFFLERAFVNLDGLANNRALQDAIRDRRLAEYLEASGVSYLALAFWDAPQAFTPLDRMYRSRIFPAAVAGPNYEHYDFTLYSYVHNADSEPIRLCPAQEVYREAIGRDGTANAAIVIFRLRRPVTASVAGKPEADCGPRAPAR